MKTRKPSLRMCQRDFDVLRSRLFDAVHGYGPSVISAVQVTLDHCESYCKYSQHRRQWRKMGLP